MTDDEARDLIIQTARMAVRYWSEGEHKKPDGTPYETKDLISGAMFTFLAELDGVGAIPPCDICVLDCDPETGEKIGETRVSTMLHEYFYEKPDASRKREVGGER